ncbi:unnamed protein product [Linum trigynum]|uniref:Pentatricopeptide repeat-containing protein n=1 Tax=Linum trigynum TaxID=586398 RepID=A0AAV2EHV5_9ROSI
MKWTCLGAKRLEAKSLLIKSRYSALLTTFPPKLQWLLQLPLRQYRNYPAAGGECVVETRTEALHARAVKGGPFCCISDSSISINYLLILYSKSADFTNAHKLFDEILDRDVRTWTILISGYARNGAHKDVMEWFRRMQLEGVRPNQFTLSTVLKSLCSLYEVKAGKGIHGWILRNGVVFDVVLANSILDLYVKSGAFSYAERLFGVMPGKDTVSWNIMMGAYLHLGEARKSLELFDSLQTKDVASWNTIVDGLIRCGCESIALEVLYRMAGHGPEFNAITFSIGLNLASCLSVLQLGKQIHGKVQRRGIDDSGFITSSLIDMYCKCGELRLASVIFEQMCYGFPPVDAMARRVSWSSMVSGYVKKREYICAFQMFKSMFEKNVEVDIYTLTSIISTCAATGNLELGRQIDAHVQKVGHKVDAHLTSSFIDMYSKCGCLNDAIHKFNESNNDMNVVIWTSMIYGFGLHGRGMEAVRLFDLMLKDSSIAPNLIAFLAVLNACCHNGLFEHGIGYFESMQKVYGLNPGVEHYTCMVDLYGRAGRFDEAKRFIAENGISHLSAVWKSLLSSCRLQKNAEMGKWACERLLELEPLDPGSYVLCSSMFSADDHWEEAAEARSLMLQRTVNKVPGQSWILLKDPLP